MEVIVFAYSLILMKTLEIKGENVENVRGVLTKLAISQLLGVLYYKFGTI